MSERLREAILSYALGPDELLGEDWLATQLNVSRGPVREALAQLEREGLVFRDRNRTAHVARLTLTDVDEIFSLRLAYERLAITQAMQRNHSALVAGLRSSLAHMRHAVKSGVTEYESCSLDIAFHDQIYQLSGHDRLRAGWAVIKPQVQLSLLARAVANNDFGKRLVPTHLTLLKAVEKKDVEQAMAAVDEHLQASYKRVVASFPLDSEAGAATVPVSSQRTVIQTGRND